MTGSADADERFEQLHRDHGRALLAYLTRRTSDGWDAADLASEVFEIVWRRRHVIPQGDQGKLWLFGVARKLLANHRRKAVRRSDAIHRLGESIDRARSQTPHEHSELDEALENLAPIDREIITLAFWEQLSLADIAQVLDMKAATVRTRFRRARLELEQVLVASHTKTR